MMTKLSFILLLLLFAGMAMISSCAEEENLDLVTMSPTERLITAKNRVAKELKEERHRRSALSENRELEFLSKENGNCNCYIRLNGFEIDLPVGIQPENVQAVLQAGGALCSTSNCAAFYGKLDPFEGTTCEFDPNSLPLSNCIDEMNYGGFGTYPFNCEIPLYSSIEFELYVLWAKSEFGDCMAGTLESVTLSLSLVCAYMRCVNKSGHETILTLCPYERKKNNSETS